MNAIDRTIQSFTENPPVKWRDMAESADKEVLRMAVNELDSRIQRLVQIRAYLDGSQTFTEERHTVAVKNSNRLVTGVRKSAVEELGLNEVSRYPTDRAHIAALNQHQCTLEAEIERLKALADDAERRAQDLTRLLYESCRRWMRNGT